MACRRTAVVLSCLAAAGAHAPWPKGKCDDASPASGTCCDADQTNNAKCVEHVRWAMGEGVTGQPDWYDIYDVHKGDTFANFQCALFFIAYNKANQAHQAGFPDEHHACARPCTATVLDDCSTDPKKVPAPPAPPAAPASPNFKKGPSFKKSTCPVVAAPADCSCGDKDTEYADGGLTCTKPVCIVEAECPSLDTWVIVLIVLLVLALLGAAVYFLQKGPKEKTKKKKRALKPPPPAEPPAPAATAQPQSFTMAPVHTVMQVPPTVIQAAPVYSGIVTTAPPTTATMVQAPVHTTAVPMVQYAAPAPHPMQSMVQYAAPAPQHSQYAVAQPQMMHAVPAYQQGVSLFDSLDKDGDGVISRAEMAAMMQPMR